MNYLYAFLIGGAICAVAQIFIDKTKLTPARILVGCVVLGVVLSAVGLYGPLKEFAGAGATVPLTGFGHLLAEGVRKAVAENPEVIIAAPGTSCREQIKHGTGRTAYHPIEVMYSCLAAHQ